MKYHLACASSKQLAEGGLGGVEEVLTVDEGHGPLDGWSGWHDLEKK